jgi:hypothetical protein
VRASLQSLDEAATALRSARRKRIEMRRVTPDVSISFDRRRRLAIATEASGPPARRPRHGACRQASADRKGVTVKAESRDLDLSGCDQLTRRDTRRS